MVLDLIDMRARAVELVEKTGWRVFKLWPGTKIPAVTNFPAVATNDVEKVRRLWTNTLTGDSEDYNLGVLTGETIVAIDEDNKNGSRGADKMDFWF